MAWEDWYLDVILVPLGLVVLSAYHVYFVYCIRRKPLTTVVGVNHLNRRAWVRGIMRDEAKYGVLAIQTTRNSIMASTLLASTSITAAAAVASFISSTTSSTLQHSLGNIVLGSTSQVTLTIKFFCVLICLLFSFLCFVQAIRYTNHVNFIITIPMGPEAPGLNPDYVSRVFARGNDFYTAGTRGYHFAFPLILWVFGPIFMFVACVAFVPLLYITDFRSDKDKKGENEDLEARCEGQRESPIARD